MNKYVDLSIPQYIFRLIIISCLLLTATSCDKSTQSQSLRIAHNSWPGYEPLPLAESEGLYQNLSVINYRVGSATEVIRAFEQDVVDVAAVTLDEAIVFQSKNKEPVYIIAVLDISHGGDVIIASRDIASIRDLKGKRVGLESSALGAFFISRAIDSVPGISLNQLKMVPMLYDQHFASFMADEVDAIVTFEPIKSKILRNKGHVIFDSSVIENEIIDVLITKKSTMDKKSAELKKFIAGYFKSLDYIKKYPEKSLSKMAEFENVSVSSFNKSLSGLRIPDKTENYNLLSGESPAIKVTIDKLYVFLRKNKLISKNIEMPIFYTDKFLPIRDAIAYE